MKRTAVSCLLIVVLLAAGFIGCQNNPYSPKTDTNTTDTTGQGKMPMLVITGDSLDAHSASYVLSLRANVFQPPADSARLIGLSADGKDWSNWRLGKLGTRGGDSVWTFVFIHKNGLDTLNFSSNKGWAQDDSLSKLKYWVPSDSNGKGNLIIDFENGNANVRSGSSTTPNGTDTITIIKYLVVDSLGHVRDTVIDTVHTATHDTTKVHIIDTVKVPGRIDTIMLGDLIKQDGSPTLVANGAFKVNMLIHSILIKKNPDTSKTAVTWYPFAIGLPSWDTVVALGKMRTDGYYPVTVILKTGYTPFDVGGDYKHKIWGDSTIEAHSPWGHLTPSGEILDLYTNKAGWIFPASLVAVDSAALVVHDTLVKWDTLTLPGKMIIDSIFIIRSTNTRDTIRDTINTFIIQIKRDTVTLPGKTIFDTLRILQLVHDTLHSRDTVTRIVLQKDTVIKIVIDTVTKPGSVIFDTIKVNTVTHDTTIKFDTVALTRVDKGTVTDSTKTGKLDTAWLDSNKLKGVVTLDTTVLRRSIHTVLWISPKGDSSYKSDTTFSSPLIYQYRSDTISLVFVNYTQTAVGADTVDRFGMTVKLFAYSGKNDVSFSLTGLSDTSQWKFVGIVGGYVVFDAKFHSGTNYNLNAVGNNGTWAQQQMMLLDPRAIKTGGSCDFVVKSVFGTGLVKP